MSELAIDLERAEVVLGRTRVLREVDLRVAPGARLGLIGPAAAGKSVLLKLLGALVPLSAGAARVLGESLAGKREAQLGALRRRIGMLFQNPALFDFLDIAGNVAFPLEQRGELPAAEITAAVRTRLAAVGLAGSEHKTPAQLSGGMKKRAGIARASIARPELLLYDEPTAGLDPVTSRKIFDLLEADQRATGATLVVASSDVAALLGFVQEVAFVWQGQVRAVLPVPELAATTDPDLAHFLEGSLPLEPTPAPPEAAR